MDEVLDFLHEVLTIDEIQECMQLLENSHLRTRSMMINEFLQDPSITNKIKIKFNPAWLCTFLSENHLEIIKRS
jgi:hypothetical protein